MIKKIIFVLTILALSSISSVASKTRWGSSGTDVDIYKSFNRNNLAFAGQNVDGNIRATKGSNIAVDNSAVAGNNNRLRIRQ